MRLSVSLQGVLHAPWLHVPALSLPWRSRASGRLGLWARRPSNPLSGHRAGASQGANAVSRSPERRYSIQLVKHCLGSHSSAGKHSAL
ncbi:hypothetical protein MHYP_G00315910 [Metynnis hypsauchen]